MCLLSLFKIEKNSFKNQNECPSCLSSPLTVTDWASLLPALSAGQLVLADSSWTSGYIISNAWKSWHHHIGFVTFRIVVIPAFLANVHVQLIWICSGREHVGTSAEQHIAHDYLEAFPTMNFLLQWRTIYRLQSPVAIDRCIWSR